MGSVRDRWRSHLLQTLSGTDDGRPRRLLGLSAPPFPAIAATGAVLRSVRTMLGDRSTSEDAALSRIARLAGDAGDADADACDESAA